MRKRTLALALGIGATSLVSGGQQAQALSLFFTDARYDQFLTFDNSKLAGSAQTSIVSDDGSETPKYIRTVDFEQGGTRAFNIYLNPYDGSLSTPKFTAFDLISFRISTNSVSGGYDSRELTNLDFKAAAGSPYFTDYNVISTSLGVVGTKSTSGASLATVSTLAAGNWVTQAGGGGINQLNDTEFKVNILGLDFSKDARYYGTSSKTGTPILLGTLLAKAGNGPQAGVEKLVMDGEGDLMLSVGRITAKGTGVSASANIRKNFYAPYLDQTFNQGLPIPNPQGTFSTFGDQPFTNTSLTEPGDFLPVQTIDAVPVPLETDLAGVAAIGGLATIYWRRRQKQTVLTE